MVTVMITHEVKNFDEWKKGFDSDAERRESNGMTITGLYRALDNENMVTITSQAASAEVVQGFLSNPEMKEKMASVGVVSMPEVKILNQVN